MAIIVKLAVILGSRLGRICSLGFTLDICNKMASMLVMLAWNVRGMRFILGPDNDFSLTILSYCVN